MPATPRTRFAIPAVLATAIALALALPAAASAATQTLTVTKAGANAAIGTVTSSPAGISCGATCSHAFTEGEVVTLTGAPGANTAPVVWSGCDSITLEKKCKVTMSAAKAVTATFNVVKRLLKVEKKGSGTGTVTSSPGGIGCGATCSAEYDGGAEVTLSAVSGANTVAVAWGGCTSVSEGKCKVTMSAAKTVTATFNLEKHKLTVTKNGTGAGTVSSSPAGISCGAGSGCEHEFDHGAALTLTATSAAGTEAAKWSGCDSVNAENKCLVTISAAKAVTAIFNHPQFPLTLTKAGPGAATATVTSTPVGMSCGAICSFGFDQGSTATLTAFPGPHTEAAEWFGCTSVNGSNQCLVTMSAAKAVTASFALAPGAHAYVLTVAKTGNGQGAVAGSPGSIQCGAACSAELVEGAKVTFTATPAAGSVFAHWSGGGCSGGGPCTTTLNSARTVKAVFNLSGQRTLTVNKAGTGTGTVSGKAAGIDCGATCSSQVPAAKKVTLSAKPAAGSAFAHWSGACSGTAKTCTVTMSEARSATATFERVPTASPPPSSCVVPKLARRSLSQARSALRAAHCKLGKVSKPKAKKGKKLGPLLVKSSSPAPGATLPAGGKVNLKLKKAHKPRHG